MRKYVQQLKERPEHVRHNIALGVSVGVTGLVALVWLTSMAATDAFALKNPEGGAAEEASAEFAGTRSNFSELLGAVGESLGATSSDPELRIVDGDTTSTLTAPPSQNQTNATVIPF